MQIVASMLFALGPVFEPGPVLPEDLAHPQGIEVSQIQRHLSKVEHTLRRATPPPDATPEALRARERALDALHDYWIAGEFPKNRDFPGRRVPYFIDADGTACAVGHLMFASGDSALAREIATYENNDFVADIDHPEVAPWLERNALTAEEAAWIQPVYDGNPCVIEPGGGIVCGTDDRSYECEALVLQCAAPVQVRSVGLCPGDGTPDVIGSEICAVESTGGESTGQGSDEAESGTDDDDGDKGCRTGKSPPTAVVMLFIALLRRRRRRW